MEGQAVNLPVSELTVKDQVLRDIGGIIEDCLEKIAENVDKTGEKASFTVKCELTTDKEGDHFFNISGKTSLATPVITRGATIRGQQLTLFGL